MKKNEHFKEFEKQIYENCNIEYNKHDGSEVINTSMSALMIAFDEYLNKILPNELKGVSNNEQTKKFCQCECPTGREVDENYHQICTTCGLPTS
jgi:uncharacterized iron-regulated protein